ncbi:two component transcriptional regulator, LuxR family [Filimonas lacunae]|uniref:Two component transcriptional regulator, LuxR family n=1 Tax=Filimonas lacunae TaxID=477680 RepID=A0A173MBJ7_9BACT|nr:response regulator transcription factor [Filimonas lacunae]BAV04934.1 two-component transcriptional regulator, LuxR family [Filimonas lacunae]SIT33766.1 two component transcriptional regulator, LuxR family [Filimonas lacunae]
MINVIITDDHPVVSNGLKNMLQKQQHITVTAVFANATDLVANIRKTPVDVLILDMKLPDGNGYDTCCTVLKFAPKTRVLVFSNNDTVYQINKMMQAGCMGYLPKNADDSMIVKAIESVYEGQRFLSPSLENALLEEHLRSKNKNQKTTLTKREKEVLELIVKEYTNQEIANQLFLSLSTIEFHRNSLLQKLNVKNTAGLVRVAIQAGLIS